MTASALPLVAEGMGMERDGACLDGLLRMQVNRSEKGGLDITPQGRGAGLVFRPGRRGRSTGAGGSTREETGDRELSGHGEAWNDGITKGHHGWTAASA